MRILQLLTARAPIPVHFPPPFHHEHREQREAPSLLPQPSATIKIPIRPPIGCCPPARVCNRLPQPPIGCIPQPSTRLLCVLLLVVVLKVVLWNDDKTWHQGFRFSWLPLVGEEEGGRQKGRTIGHRRDESHSTCTASEAPATVCTAQYTVQEIIHWGH